MVIPKYKTLSRKESLLFLTESKEAEIKTHNNSILVLRKEVRELKYKILTLEK